jgi:hypothetical protein
MVDEDCSLCHSEAVSRASGQTIAAIDFEAFGETLHGSMGVGCTSCHADTSELEGAHPAELAPAACAECHGDVVEALAKGAHKPHPPGSGLPDTPSCPDCHGAHDIRPPEDKDSTMHAVHQVQRCGRCHADELRMKPTGLKSAAFIEAYETSVHGKALAAGNEKAPACSTCHGAHQVQRHDAPESKTSREHVAELCGGCHGAERDVYLFGIHGQELQKGNPDVPVCTSCHGEHGILPPADEHSPVAPSRVSMTCSACHDDVVLAERYHLPTNRLRSYLGTYHGIASAAGVTTAANCASCHGYHGVLPSSDPASTIHPNNLARTCGKCHPNAGANFAKGMIHLTDPAKQNIGVYIVRVIYTSMIAGMIGMFIILIIIQLYGHYRFHRHREHGGVP